MKLISYLCVFVVLAAACLINGQNVDFRPLRTSPAFIWGNNNYLFSGQNIQVLDIASSDDIKNALLHNKIKTVLSHHFVGGDSQQPELFFMFVQDQLRSDQVSALGDSLHNVKTLVESAQSSMAIPYVYPMDTSYMGVDIALSLNQIANKVIVATNGESSDLPVSLRKNVITLDKLMTLSGDNSWELLNNNQMDVVIVFFDSYSANNNLPTVGDKMMAGIAADDAFIGKLISNVEKKANYVALYTAQQPSAQVQYFFPSSGANLVRFEQSILQVEEVDGSCNNCLWPNDVLEGLIVIAPFLIILIIGVTCNFQIQSELKYDAEKVKRF